MEIDFNRVPEKTFERIWSRIQSLGGGPERETLAMDLAAANGVNGNPRLALNRLVFKFDDFSFMHDIWGIHRHMDRDTGRITGHFLPRCAISEKETDE